MLTGLDVTVADAEFHVVHVGVVDADRGIEIVGILIARRVVADRLAFRVFLFELGPALADVEVAARGLAEVKNVRIRFAEPARAGDHEFPVVVVDEELHVLAEAAGRAECRHGLPVRLAALELGCQLCLRAVAAAVEPGGELGRAVLAHVAVLELAVAEEADLVAAEVAVFLIKKAHSHSFLIGDV